MSWNKLSQSSSVTQSGVNGHLTINGQDISVYDDTDIRTSLGVPKINPEPVSQMSIYFEGTNSDVYLLPAIKFDLSSISTFVGTSQTITLSFTPDISQSPTAITRFDDWIVAGAGNLVNGTQGNIVTGTPISVTRTITPTSSILNVQPLFRSGVAGGTYKVTMNNLQVTLNGTSILGYMYDAGINGSFQPTMTSAKVTKTKTHNTMSLNSRWIGKRWGAIGDSITAGFNSVGSTQTYPNTVGTALNVLHMSNLGVGGRTVAVNPNDSGNLTNNLVNDAARPYMDYDLITIALGTNDYGNNLPLGTIGNKTDTTSSFNQNTFYGAYRYFLNTVMTNYPYIQIVLMLPIYRTSDGANSLGLTLDDYRNAIINIGKMYNLPVWGSNIGINSQNASFFLYGDGLHPNADGHARLADHLSAYLSAI